MKQNCVITPPKMDDPKDLSRLLPPQSLFWGQDAIVSLLPSQEVAEQLFSREIHDWLSSLYWTEGLAVKYSLFLREVVEDQDKAQWDKVYRDEVLHQSLVGQWLIDRGHSPLPPNPLIERAEKSVAAVVGAKDKASLEKAMVESQIFFESLGQKLLKKRLSKITDRSLQALLYRIYTDEARHIATGLGHLEVSDLNYKKELEKLDRRSAILFPLGIADGLLDDETKAQVKSKAKEASLALFERKEDEHYSPHQFGRKFEALPGYNCVACSPKREDGLLLQPKPVGETEVVEDKIEFRKNHEGFNGIAHGGFITMALDEMMGYALIFNKNLLPLTKTIEVEFLRPVPLNRKLRITSQIEGQTGPNYRISGQIVDDQSGKELAKASGDFYVIHRDKAKLAFGKLGEIELVKSMLRSDEN